MKAFIPTLLIPLILATFPAHAQQAEKTLVKSFNVKNYSTIMLDFEGEVILKSWKEDQMRVMMNIKLLDGTESVLKSLVQAGRYNLNVEEADGELKIIAPGLNRQVKLRNGSDLGEHISFVVYAPENVQVKTRADEATGMVEVPKTEF